jgi:phosphoribosylformylglycinamidine (FGAM) synthase-like enzyme
MCSKSWITNQYDRYVAATLPWLPRRRRHDPRRRGNRPRRCDGSTDANGRYTYSSPTQGAQLALAEAYRNVATSGAVPMAVSDCLNFGSPEDPDVMWQLAEAIRGLSDACMELGIPVTGGNVSLYNQTGTTPIHPTPLVAVLGKLDDVARRTPSGWRDEGQAIYLLGTTSTELSTVRNGPTSARHLGGLPPKVDLAASAPWVSPAQRFPRRHG